MFRRAEFRLASLLLVVVAVAGLVPGAAQAQFRGGYAFLQAVDSRDGTKATAALKDDASLINTRNPDSGETALILAVQSKNVAMVRLLVRNGANPGKADHATGMTARDYAKRDDRTGQIIAILDAKPDGPVRDLGPKIGPN